LGANVCDALQREINVNGIARLQIVLDRLDDELNQITVGVDEYGNEEVALKSN